MGLKEYPLPFTGRRSVASSSNSGSSVHIALRARGAAPLTTRALSHCTHSAAHHQLPRHIRGRGGRTAPRVREEASAARYCATAGGRGRGHGRNLRFRAISPRDAARRATREHYTVHRHATRSLRSCRLRE